jgi:NitT/TauT family transport system substrate-binding protein
MSTLSSVVASLGVAFWLVMSSGAYGQSEQSARPVKIGSLGHSLGFLQLDIAEAKGWLKTSRLDGQVVYFKAGKDASTALLEGAIDAAVLGIDHAVTGQQRGVPIKQVALLNRLPGWILVVSRSLEPQVRSVADLRGRKVGVTAPGSATHILLSYLLARNGLSGSDVTVVRAGVDTLPEIMAQGGIEAGMALEPFGSSVLADGSGFALVDFRSLEQVRKHLGGTYPVTALLVRQDLVDRDPAAVQDLTTAIVWASRWLAQASAEDVVSVLPPDYVPEAEVWRRSLEGYREAFSADGRNDPDGIRRVLEAQAAFDPQFKPASIDVQALYSDEFWNKAIAAPVPNSGGAPLTTQNAEASRRAGLGLFVAVLVVLVGLALLLARRSRLRGE